MTSIGNSLGWYIDKSEPKYPMFSCAWICVEVDLKKGLPEVVNLIMDSWSHEQKVDYDQLHFKCKKWYGCGHFARDCTRNIVKESEKEKEKERHWVTRKRKTRIKSIIANQLKASNSNQFQLLVDGGDLVGQEEETKK